MATSTIPAVKAALFSLLAAAVTGSDVLVTYATGRADKPREWVRLGRVTGDQAAAAIGRQRRSEKYRVEVLVSVVKSDIDTPQSVAERAYAIVAQIETAIRANETLGVAGLIWARVEKTDLEEGSAGGESWAEVTVHVGCESRI